MTIEEAVGLVLEAARLARGGETFVLDMGEPVRIIDLVANFVNQLHLADGEIRYTGLRAGEKLHETLFSETEERLPTEHPRIFSTVGLSRSEAIEDGLESLYAAAARNAAKDVMAQLLRLVPTYRRVLTPAPAAVATRGLTALYPDDY